MNTDGPSLNSPVPLNELKSIKTQVKQAIEEKSTKNLRGKMVSRLKKGHYSEKNDLGKRALSLVDYIPVTQRSARLTEAVNNLNKETTLTTINALTEVLDEEVKKLDEVTKLNEAGNRPMSGGRKQEILEKMEELGESRHTTSDNIFDLISEIRDVGFLTQVKAVHDQSTYAGAGSEFDQQKDDIQCEEELLRFNHAREMYKALNITSDQFPDETAANNEETLGGMRFANTTPLKHMVPVEAYGGRKMNICNVGNVGNVGQEYEVGQGPQTAQANEDSIPATFAHLSESGGTIVNLTSNNDLNGDRGDTLAVTYWPEKGKSESYQTPKGQLTVSTTNIESYTGYDVIHITITEADKSQQPIKVFHFKEWPDHGVPKGEQLEAYRNFLKRLRREGQSEGVRYRHCKAGLGRSATHTVLEQVMDGIDRGTITKDNLKQFIQSAVLNGRVKRGKTYVQSAEQLRLIFAEALNYLENYKSIQREQLYADVQIKKPKSAPPHNEAKRPVTPENSSPSSQKKLRPIPAAKPYFREVKTGAELYHKVFETRTEVVDYNTWKPKAPDKWEKQLNLLPSDELGTLLKLMNNYDGSNDYLTALPPEFIRPVISAYDNKQTDNDIYQNNDITRLIANYQDAYPYNEE